MKQTITVEQLNELSKKGKERLTDWRWNKADPADRLPGSTISLTLSIGQLIEFLDDNGHDLYSINTEEKDGKRIKFMVTFRDESMKHALFGNRPELCDALWEAVKEVLEK